MQRMKRLIILVDAYGAIRFYLDRTILTSGHFFKKQLVCCLIRSGASMKKK